MIEKWAILGNTFASLLVLGTVIQRYSPFRPETILIKCIHKLTSFIYPYVQIKISEYTGEYMKRSEAYAAIEAYLSASCSQRAHNLKAELGKDSTKPVLSMDGHEEVTDEFGGTTFWWSSNTSIRQTQALSLYPDQEEKRSYRLTFHKSNRQLVLDSYLSHVLREGREVGIRNRRRKLYCNNPSSNWGGYRSKVWSHVAFEHPSRFETLAMDAVKKRKIMKDLEAFRKGKDYYAKIGKAWKRGYLLYGPPGTGKSSMIAAIADFLDYDVYDLELTTVKDNTELRKLFIETTGKSVIVIEDIDCSLDLTGQRKQKSKKEEDKSEEKKNLPPGLEEEKESSKVTLSGLLNFIDGLWSACGGERLIVFTTNHKEKLDPALIRRGRMDKHIEMSYCCFDAFKVLAKNYLDVDSHPLFGTIQDLMEEVKITPADVAENLMQKSVDEDAGSCLEKLIQAMNKAREEEASKQAQASIEEIVGRQEKSGAKEEETSKHPMCDGEDMEGEGEKKKELL
ncbi:AAA-ATPase ASD, mitochondrial [Cocos nucifera]|uniref:AAA-ATPase ASD, mitochondrial n=1 Tax=Cocos nucifera TaxID=13894 RepID=A0A8K0N321_COCNU|nr:AAA-ATPase ASD, mitochondrial [Cocos nucifera]